MDREVQPGDKVPPFELEDENGVTRSLYGALENGPILLVFYRGDW